MLLGYADRFPPFSHDLYIVRQTAADYLPRTLAAYLAVPGTDDPIVRATGRTALEELRAQLALLDSRLDAITQNLQQQDLDGLRRQPPLPGGALRHWTTRGSPECPRP